MWLFGKDSFLFYHGQAYSPQVFGSEKIPAIAHLWTQSCFWSKTSFIKQPSYAPHQSLNHPIGRPETGNRCSKDCQKSLSSYVLPRTSGPPTTPYFQIGRIFLQNYQRWCHLFWIHIVQVWAAEQLFHGNFDNPLTVPTSPLRNTPPPLPLSGVSYTEEEALHLLWNRSVL